jgi:glyoxylase-like metal-dependent hydrolase (beta-lactamase superfamily II)
MIVIPSDRRVHAPTLVATLVATVIISALGASPAFAAAPMAKTSAPGFFRFMLGDFEITALNDGTFDMPADQLLKNTTPAKVSKALAKVYLKLPVEGSLNAFAINTGSKLILVDTGAAGLFAPTLGKVVANLKASGYQPEQVDEIYITHMHVDHVGGLTASGRMVFPNAVVRADKKESDFWLSPENLAKAPAEMKKFFEGAVASLTPYVKAGKFKPFEGATDLTPGIKSFSSPGHTPGHTSYIVESKGQKLVLVGDLIHVGAVQFDEPAVTIAFDSDAKAATAERKKAFSEAAKEGYLIGAAHLQFPGIGHVRTSGKGFQWLPLNFTQLR